MAKPKLDIDNLPSNNQLRPNIRPVKANLQHPVRQAKRGGLTNEVRDIFNSQFSNMMIPSVMRLVYDFLEGALRMLILKENSGIGRFGGASHTSYNRPYRASSAATYHRSSYGMAPQRRVLQETPYEDIVFGSRAEAEDVWRIMMGVIEEYGVITVGHLYSICGLENNRSHFRWGWTDVSQCGIGRMQNGYFIDLPNPAHQ